MVSATLRFELRKRPGKRHHTHTSVWDGIARHPGKKDGKESL